MADFPVNEHSEKCVLGSCIECQSLVDEALATGISDEDFSVVDYQRIFRALVAMNSQGLPVDLISLWDFLGEYSNDLPLITDLAFGALVSKSHVAHHAKIVKKYSRLRALLRTSEWIAQKSVEPCANPDEIIRRTCETVTTL